MLSTGTVTRSLGSFKSDSRTFLGLTCNGGVLGVLSERFFVLCDASDAYTEQPL